MAFDEDCLMLIIEDSQYHKKVPIQVSTIYIDRILDLMTPAKLAKLNKEWMHQHIMHLLAIKSTQVQTKQKEQR